MVANNVSISKIVVNLDDLYHICFIRLSIIFSFFEKKFIEMIAVVITPVKMIHIPSDGKPAKVFPPISKSWNNIPMRMILIAATYFVLIFFCVFIFLLTSHIFFSTPIHDVNNILLSYSSSFPKKNIKLMKFSQNYHSTNKH